MKYFLFIYSFFSILNVNSQALEAKSTVGTVTSMNDIFTKHLMNSGKEEILGTPFLYQNWDNDGIVFSEGNSYSLKNFNYNIISDNIGTLKGKDSVLTFNKIKIDSFLLKKRMFKKYYDSFYEVLYEGTKISLIKKYEVNIVEGMFNPIDGTKEKSRFKIIDDYYFNKSNDIVKFIPSKKSVLNIFGDNEVMIKKYIKQNRLSFKSENDLIKIFDYYNKL